MPEYEVQHIPLDQIYIDAKFNFRGYVAPMDVLQLAQSIKDRGLDTPITVQPFTQSDNPSIRYRVVAGHRRCTAHHVLQKETIPCFVRNFDSELNAHVFNLLENVERKDLTLLQEVEALGYLASFKNANGTQTLKVDDISTLLHQSKSWVVTRLEIMKLDEDVRKEACAGLLTQENIKHLCKMKTRAEQIDFIKQMKDKKLKGEKLKVSRSIEQPSEVLKARRRKPEEITELKNILYDMFGPSLVTRVLAYADGSISYAALTSDIKEAAKAQGIDYQVPESIGRALTGAF